MEIAYTLSQGFIKIAKRGQNLTVKKAWGGGITSLAVTPHAVFTSSRGEASFWQKGANVPL